MVGKNRVEPGVNPPTVGRLLLGIPTYGLRGMQYKRRTSIESDCSGNRLVGNWAALHGVLFHLAMEPNPPSPHVFKGKSLSGLMVIILLAFYTFSTLERKYVYLTCKTRIEIGVA